MAENIDAERAAFEAWAKAEHENLGGEFAGPGNAGWYYWDDLVAAAWEAWIAASRTPSAPIGEDGLPPIEYDRGADRTYIPLPGGWEIQTKGNGSTFRIAHVQQQTRWQVLEDSLHEPLEAMARDTRSALAAKDAEIANLRAQLARQSQGVSAADTVSLMLWLYRRLPRAYGRPPHVETPIAAMAKIAGIDVTDSFAERDPAPPLSREQQANADDEFVILSVGICDVMPHPLFSEPTDAPKPINVTFFGDSITEGRAGDDA